MTVASLITLLPVIVQSVVKPIIGLVAVVMFYRNYRVKKDPESLGWMLLCVLWAI